MPCYHPLKAFRTGSINVNTGNSVLRLCPWDTDHISLWIDGHEEIVRDFIKIPCGKCLGCQIARAKEWTSRLLMEQSTSETAYFVTLTYNDEFLPFTEPNEEGLSWPTIRHRDFQLFIKRLRKHFSDRVIRFYCTSEYGPRTLRPHYHAIIYGLPSESDDFTLEPFQSTQHGMLYRCKAIEDCWSQWIQPSKDPVSGELVNGYYKPMGFVLVGDCSAKTCGYVARYVNKKFDPNIDKYVRKTGVERPHAMMSRRPGIGYDYFQLHPDLLDFDQICLPSSTYNPNVFTPPDYFFNVLSRYDPQKAEELKLHRHENAVDAYNSLLARLEKPYLEYLSDCEKSFISKTKSLKRDKI